MGIIGTNHKRLEKIKELTVSQFVLVPDYCEDDQISEDDIDYTCSVYVRD